mmetsp:Transcript_25430/g.64049  ORF Transcript_25430/g.64049 Transcript_25430/m.64049 type:complete len:211 (+) Transcript_25430:622-1254(+)
MDRGHLHLPALRRGAEAGRDDEEKLVLRGRRGRKRAEGLRRCGKCDLPHRGAAETAALSHHRPAALAPLRAEEHRLPVRDRARRGSDLRHRRRQPPQGFGHSHLGPGGGGGDHKQPIVPKLAASGALAVRGDEDLRGGGQVGQRERGGVQRANPRERSTADRAAGDGGEHLPGLQTELRKADLAPRLSPGQYQRRTPPAARAHEYDFRGF